MIGYRFMSTRMKTALQLLMILLLQKTIWNYVLPENVKKNEINNNNNNKGNNNNNNNIKNNINTNNNQQNQNINNINTATNNINSNGNDNVKNWNTKNKNNRIIMDAVNLQRQSIGTNNNNNDNNNNGNGSSINSKLLDQPTATHEEKAEDPSFSSSVVINNKDYDDKVNSPNSNERPGVSESDHLGLIEEEEEDEMFMQGSDTHDDLDDAPNLFQVNEKEALEEKDGVLHLDGEPGSHVDSGDVMYDECEEEMLFGTSGNMKNPKCEKILKDRQKELENSTKREIMKIGLKEKWPIPVPYTIKNITDFGGKYLDYFLKAFEYSVSDFAKKSCLKFRVKNDKDEYWLDFRRGRGCNSHVGRNPRKKGAHIINIQENVCDFKKTVSHEIMHALGFWHEQSRYDRDNYVTIRFENVRVENGVNMSYNFDKLTNNKNTLGYKYDVTSIMHYPRKSFGIIDGKDKKGYPIERETIVPKNRDVARLGGCPDCELTMTDALQVNELYCNAKRLDRKMKKWELKEKAKQWLQIYRGRDNNYLARKVSRHLQLLFRKYNFIVIATDSIKGEPDDFTDGNCITERFCRDLTICYTIRTTATWDRRLVAKKVYEAVNLKECTMGSLKENIKAALPNLKVAGMKAIPFGFNAFVFWRRHAKAILRDITCKDGGWASIAIIMDQ